MSHLRNLSVVALLSLGACSGEQIVENTGDAVVFTGKTIVKGAVGATKLAARGTKAGIQRIQSGNAEYPTGTLVCTDDAGEIYATATEQDGKPVCPPLG